MLDRFLTYRRWILALLVLGALGMLPGLGQLLVSHRMDDYFSPEGEDLEVYNQYREAFGDDDQFMLLALEANGELYSRNFLQPLDSLKQQIRRLPKIREVFWIDDVLPENVRLRRSVTEPIIGHELFVSKDHDAASLMILHDQLNGREEIREVVESIQQLLTGWQDHQPRLAGKGPFSLFLEEYIIRDSGWLFGVTFGLVFLLLMLFLGSLRLLLISLGVPLLAMGFTLGLMGWMGIHINLFTALIPTLILIISVSDILHIVRGSGSDKGMERVRRHAAALILTSVTTAIGFGSLITTGIPAMMQFGGFTAVGVLYTLLLTIALFSGLNTIQAPTGKAWERALDKLVVTIRTIHHRRWLQLGILAGFVMFILGGIFQVKVNSYLIDGVPANTEVKKDAMYFDAEFAGTRPLSVLVTAPGAAQQPSQQDFLALDSLIRHFFHARFLLGPQLSLLTDIPELKVNSDDGQLHRYFGLMDDLGSHTVIRQFDSLSAALAADPDLAGLNVRYTGIAQMLDNSTEDVAASIRNGLLTALVVTFILLAIYFRGVKVAAISIVINLLPLLVLGALYGYLGITLRPGTAVVFTIAFGIAIDDIMHILSTLKKQGHQPDFGQVIAESGKPVILTSLVFGLSFLVLVFAGLESIHVLGLSMVAGCAAALISDLFLLPGLLGLFPPSSTHRS